MRGIHRAYTGPAQGVNSIPSVEEPNISVIQISPEIAELSVNFGSEINIDSADRIIAATSITYNAQLVTADTNLIESELIDTLW